MWVFKQELLAGSSVKMGDRRKLFHGFVLFVTTLSVSTEYGKQGPAYRLRLLHPFKLLAFTTLQQTARELELSPSLGSGARPGSVGWVSPGNELAVVARQRTSHPLAIQLVTLVPKPVSPRRPSYLPPALLRSARRFRRRGVSPAASYSYE